jgi:serine O-acetyltransferase
MKSQSRPDPSNLLNALADARSQYRLPPELAVAAPRFLDKALALLFPHLSQSVCCNMAGLEVEIAGLELEARSLLSLLPEFDGPIVAQTASEFMALLPEAYRMLQLDADALFKGDPAAESLDEVIIAYPGFFAIAVYRVAHILYGLHVPLIPRLLTEHAHKRTGIDIHPGASIGESFFIDHGTGVVVGETTEIGSNVKVYQGVTLGALQVSRTLRNKKRHPTIGDNVVIYAGATILGGNTFVGADSVVGGNVWLTESVPAGSVVYHKSEVHVRTNGHVDGALEFHI